MHYWPDNPTLEHYQEVFTNGDFLVALRNSAIVAASTTLLSLIIGTVGAYALGRFKFRGRLPVMYLILSMTMFPAIAILGSLFDMVRRLGLYNQLPSLIITYLVFTLPFTVWVLTSFFQALPKELEEAAYVDGASPLETLYKVMLPLIAPGLVTTGLLAFINAWNEFLFAVSFTPDARQTHRAAGDFPVQHQHGRRIRNSLGHDHGRHRRGHRAADRAGADFPEPHHFGPDGRRGEGLAAACRRSVLFFTCHDLGQHLGCYGQPTVSVAGPRCAGGNGRALRAQLLHGAAVQPESRGAAHRALSA